jgi:hypothetical protein
MNRESFNNLVEYMFLKGKVGNSCWHSLEDRFIPTAYAIHRMINKSSTKGKNSLDSSYMTHIPGFLSATLRKDACFD